MSLLGGSSSNISEPPADIKFAKFLEEEEGDVIVMEIREELLNNAVETAHANYLEKYVQQFVVDCALNAIKKAIQMNCYFHNQPYISMSKESWEPDVPAEPSTPDTWAAYRVPILCDKEEGTKPSPKEDRRESLSKPAIDRILATFDIQPRSSESSSSQDILSVTDYLDELSSSSEEEHPPSINEDNVIEIPPEEVERISVMFGKNSSEMSNASNGEKKKELSFEMERLLSSTFSKTTLGEVDRGLCIPQVNVIPTDNTMNETPETEPFIIVRMERRKTKIVRKTRLLPKRRSDTKLKMALVTEESKDKTKTKKKV